MNAHVDLTSAHAVYSPSSAHRWTVCTASATAIAAMQRDIPEEEGEAAAEGTRAHDEIDRVLSPWAETNRVSPRLEVNPEHPAAFGISMFVDYVGRLPLGQMWVEQRVRLTDQIWGRLDFGHWHAESATVTVVDYKNGYVGVDAEENDQFRIYAAALIRQFNLPAKWIRYACVQPNDFRPGPRVKQWIETVESLRVWADATSKIPTGPLTFRFGEHCRDCPLLGTCEPTKDVLRQFATVVATGASPTSAQIPLFLALKKPIDHFFEGLIKGGTKKALAGDIPPDMGLFTSVKHRTWLNVAAARAAVVAQKGVEALSPPTPAQAEAMGVDITGLVDTPEGGPVLAFIGDKRKPWAPKSASEMFAGIPGVAK